MAVTKDSARVDCLNTLSELYREEQPDTARSYARMALEEASKINYITGRAKAYQNLGRVAKRLGVDLSAADHYFTLAHRLFMQTGNEEEIAYSWGTLGFSKWVTCNFPAAMEAFKTAIVYYELKADTPKLALGYHMMSQTEKEWGHYDEALQYALKLKEISKEGFQYDLGDLYFLMGDYETALEYLRSIPGADGGWKFLSLGIIYFHQKQFDSASYYYQLFSTYAVSNEGMLRKYYAHFGELHRALKHYDSAFFYLRNALNMHRKASDRNQEMFVLLALTKAYREAGYDQRAIKAARELLQIADETGMRQYCRDAHHELYKIFEIVDKRDSAYQHLQQYTVLKDSIDLYASARKLAFYKTIEERERSETKINRLNTERKLHQHQLEQTAQQKNFLVAGIVAIFMFGVVLVRNSVLKRKSEYQRRVVAENELKIQQLESERRQALLKQQATDLEMQALRAQMNPHFIFNCLNAINSFILINDARAAADYLTRFSRLIRMVLNNSQQKLISLDQELETVGLYLHMESLRLQNKLHYRINCDNSIDAAAVFIPPMLLQPFVENSIWHGLREKAGDGTINVDVQMKMNMLYCTITDNGIGRKNSALLKSKYVSRNKSHGLQITKNRMALLNRDFTDENFQIKDLEDEYGNCTGTSVSLKIQIAELGEKNASAQF